MGLVELGALTLVAMVLAFVALSDSKTRVAFVTLFYGAYIAFEVFY